MQMLGPDDKWSSCHGDLAYLAGVYDQDESNIPQTQQGLRQLGEQGIHFARYSEVRCRNLHRMIDHYIAKGEEAKSKA